MDSNSSPSPKDTAADYRVRIFTPQRELPFAGHPTVGTAVLLGRIDGAAKTVNLCESCNPRLHPMTETVFVHQVENLLVADQHVRRVRARAYQGHLAAQHVQKLR